MEAGTCGCFSETNTLLSTFQRPQRYFFCYDFHFQCIHSKAYSWVLQIFLCSWYTGSARGWGLCLVAVWFNHFSYVMKETSFHQQRLESSVSRCNEYLCVVSVLCCVFHTTEQRYNPQRSTRWFTICKKGTEFVTEILCSLSPCFCWKPICEPRIPSLATKSGLMQLMEVWVLLTLIIISFPPVWDQNKSTQAGVYRSIALEGMVSLPPSYQGCIFRPQKRLETLERGCGTWVGVGIGFRTALQLEPTHRATPLHWSGWG